MRSCAFVNESRSPQTARTASHFRPLRQFGPDISGLLAGIVSTSLGRRSVFGGIATRDGRAEACSLPVRLTYHRDAAGVSWLDRALISYSAENAESLCA